MTRSPGGDVTDVLGGRDEADDAVLARLRQRLASRAQDRGLLDVAYTVVDSPVGPLLLAATPDGLVRVAFAVQNHDVVLQQLAARVSPRVLRAPRRLDVVARQLDEYFAGRRRAFDVVLDRRLSSGFRQEVLAELERIPYGDKRSYAQVAVAAGRGRAVRAVGSACATNPLPLVVPCHRVVRSDGSTGDYAGGPEVKRTLLSLEATGA